MSIKLECNEMINQNCKIEAGRESNKIKSSAINLQISPVGIFRRVRDGKNNLFFGLRYFPCRKVKRSNYEQKLEKIGR